VLQFSGATLEITMSTSLVSSASAADPTKLDPPLGVCPHRLHSTQMAAAIVGLAPSTMEVNRCRRRLKIAYCKVGRRVQYKEADLLAYLDRCRVEG
jgi:hypothetical protein